MIRGKKESWFEVNIDSLVENIFRDSPLIEAISNVSLEERVVKQLEQSLALFPLIKILFGHELLIKQVNRFFIVRKRHGMGLVCDYFETVKKTFSL